MATYRGLRGKVWATKGVRGKVWGVFVPETAPKDGSFGGIYKGWRGWEDKHKEAVPAKKLVKAVKKYIKKTSKLTLEERLLPTLEPVLWNLPPRALLPLFAASFESLLADRPNAEIAYECAQTLETILDEEEEQLLLFMLQEML